MSKLEQAARQAQIDLLRRPLAEQAEGVIVKICPDGYGTITTEQAEQEPVATVVDESEEQTNTMSWILSLPLPVGTKLYAAPVRTKDLTDDEIRAIRFNWERNEFAIDFARAVIAADRKKNK